MTNQLTSNAEALRLFFTEDVYLVKNESETAFAKPVITSEEALPSDNVVLPVAEKQIYKEEIEII